MWTADPRLELEVLLSRSFIPLVVSFDACLEFRHLLLQLASISLDHLQVSTVVLQLTTGVHSRLLDFSETSAQISGLFLDSTSLLLEHCDGSGDGITTAFNRWITNGRAPYRNITHDALGENMMCWVSIFGWNYIKGNKKQFLSATKFW